MNRICWIIVACMLFFIKTGSCQSALYEHFAPYEDLMVAHVTNYPIDSVTTSDFVLIKAQTQDAWERLVAEFQVDSTAMMWLSEILEQGIDPIVFYKGKRFYLEKGSVEAGDEYDFVFLRIKESEILVVENSYSELESRIIHTEMERVKERTLKQHIK